MTPCQESVSLGAYLLGALDPEERRALESHIAGCPLCRAELVELAPLPGLLRHTPFDELEESAPAAESLSPVREQSPPAAAAQHRRRNRGRVLTAAGLGLAAAVAGVVVYAGVSRNGAAPTPAQAQAAAAATWTATDPSTHVSAIAALMPEAWGTQFQLKLGGLPSGITCHLVVHDRNGNSETAGTWGSGYASSASVPASTSISPAQISTLDIVDGSGTLLVRLPAK
ncbi:anti-sigma factor RsiW [Streptacidiphilus sp. MAP12-16]|uniref:anti-sigma factor family protein n=1 Tax=Streptacidiphilus sp. MAP12-16 TaxID=3156300 RepID=UPI0035145524